jgi:hypothetical protein
MKNFEMGINNPPNNNEDELEIENSNESELEIENSNENISGLTSEDFSLLLEKFSKKENAGDISPENYDLLLKKLSKTENLDNNKEFIEELKNIEEAELSSIEVKKPFASKLRKTLLILTASLVLMSATPAFAASSENIQYDNQRIEKSESTGLEFNESTRMLTYTYIVEDDIDFNDYIKDKKLRVFATAEFGGVLQNKLNLNGLTLSGVDYEYQPGRVIMTMNFDTFIKANSNKAESFNTKPEKNETVIAENVSTVKNIEIEPEKSSNENINDLINEKPNFEKVANPWTLEEPLSFINYEGVDFFAFTSKNSDSTALRLSSVELLIRVFSKKGSVKLIENSLLEGYDKINNKSLLLIPMDSFVKMNLANIENPNDAAEKFNTWFS